MCGVECLMVGVWGCVGGTSELRVESRIHV